MLTHTPCGNCGLYSRKGSERLCQSACEAAREADTLTPDQTSLVGRFLCGNCERSLAYSRMGQYTLEASTHQRRYTCKDCVPTKGVL